MKLEDIKNISVLGAGIMGHGIAQSFLMGGYQVTLYDIEQSILETARSHIEQNLKLFSQHEFIQPADIKACLERLTCRPDLKSAVADADFIVEAAPEDPGLKQKLFKEVESCCSKEAILASNTSSLTWDQMGTELEHKDRLITAHWFNPPHIVPTVEVVRAQWTSDETLAATYDLLVKIKKSPVKINKELPGFLVNRIQMAMIREILDLYEKGVAEAEEIDRAVSGSIGFRLASIGPLRTIDLGGSKLWLKVCENLFPQIEHSIEPPRTLQRLVEQGRDGIKTGKGFYDYSTDFSKAELDQAIKKRDREFLNRLKKLYWDSDE